MPSASSGESTSNSMGRVLCRASVSKAAERETPKPTQRSQSGRKASVVTISMNVAKASLSQMPFHHCMVTRSPNHMWASSWAMTSTTFCSSGWVAVRRVDEEQDLAEGDAAEVLHGPEGEVGDGDQVELVARVGDAVVVGEVVEAEGPDLERVAGEVALADGVDDAEVDAARRDRVGDLEGADDEGDQVGRHDHGVGEVDPRPGRRRAVWRATSRALEMASRSSGTTRVTAKMALRSGSSQQGKARRASVASNWVVAMTRSWPPSSVKVLR